MLCYSQAHWETVSSSSMVINSTESKQGLPTMFSSLTLDSAEKTRPFHSLNSVLLSTARVGRGAEREDLQPPEPFLYQASQSVLIPLPSIFSGLVVWYRCVLSGVTVGISSPSLWSFFLSFFPFSLKSSNNFLQITLPPLPSNAISCHPASRASALAGSLTHPTTFSPGLSQLLKPPNKLLCI